MRERRMFGGYRYRCASGIRVESRSGPINIGLIARRTRAQPSSRGHLIDATSARRPDCHRHLASTYPPRVCNYFKACSFRCGFALARYHRQPTRGRCYTVR